MLSQCSTIFAMRLTNENDQQWVRSSLSDGIVGLLEALGSLGTAEAIGVGEGIVMPMRLVFDTLRAGRAAAQRHRLLLHRLEDRQRRRPREAARRRRPVAPPAPRRLKALTNAVPSATPPLPEPSATIDDATSSNCLLAAQQVEC